MPQLLLDPDNQKIVPSGSWTPSGPIPPRVRAFGYFPNIDDWLPGDLLLISEAQAGWVSKRIAAAQLRGGYSQADSVWTHAAMYIGDANVCEATRSGVHLNPIFDYVGTHFLRVRRDTTLTTEQRYRIAIKALARLRNSYSLSNVASLFFKSFRGFWGDSKGPVSPLGVKAVICSQLYCDAYAMATSKFITNPATLLATPAALSVSDKLTDVQVSWKRIG